MDEEIERLIVSVRADTAGFARDVAEMRSTLEGPMEAGANRAGRAIEGALLRAVRTGKLGFDDLGRVALGVMDEIARAALRGGIGAVAGQSGGLGGVLTGLVAGLFGGSPGRATGGPVSPMRPYLVGERGPELFVPTSAGQVVAPGGRRARGSRGDHGQRGCGGCAAGAGAIEPASGAGGEGGAGGGGLAGVRPRNDRVKLQGRSKSRDCPMPAGQGRIAADSHSEEWLIG